ncbi:MAG: hypothetical protein HYZ42_07465 [Bacteroidetes bacterium]|nr:hypothetical protein [Bacteroidota bacterium]
MKEINWNTFEAKFNGKQQAAFERMSYALFCSMFNLQDGIFSYKNQIGIETEPIEINGKFIGFQAKYLESSTSLSARKGLIIESLEKAKEKNSQLNEVYLYINKAYTESRKRGQKSPKYIIEIETRALSLGLILVWQVPSQIEKQLSLSLNVEVLQEFFPDFYDFQRQKFIEHDKNELLSITKTAIIQLEIEKIKESYYKYEWPKRAQELSKLGRFYDHTNETIASSVFHFLNDASDQTRGGMPSEVANEIFGLVLTYFPSSYDTEMEQRIENGRQCVFIGFNLVYDALFHITNYKIAAYGLIIWKFIYRESMRNKMPELTNLVLEQYIELEETINISGGIHLEHAKQFINIFKQDLTAPGLAFPVLPDDLYQLVLKHK